MDNKNFDTLPLPDKNQSQQYYKDNALEAIAKLNKAQDTLKPSSDIIPQNKITEQLVKTYPGVPHLDLNGIYEQVFYKYKPSKELITKEQARLNQGQAIDERIQYISNTLGKAYNIPQPNTIPNTVKNGYNPQPNHILGIGYTINDKKDKRLWGMYQKDRATHSSCLGGSGSGKSLSIRTNIYTVEIFNNNVNINNIVKKQIKDLKIGEYIISSDGNPTKILDMTPLQHANNGIYKITKKDDTSITVDGDHLWTIYTGKKSHSYKEETITTEEIYNRLNNNKKKKIYLPVSKCIELLQKKLPVDPWVLGFLIGDGCLNQPSKLIAFSTNDIDYIPQKIQNILGNKYYIEKALPNNPKDYTWYIKGNLKYFDYKYNTDLYHALKDLGLIGSYSNNKFIPEIYKQGSVEQRLALISGLMDADGSVSKGRYTYCTISKQLMDDVVEILRGLGYCVRVSIDAREEKYKHSNGKAYIYIAHIWTNDPDLITLPRKRADLQKYIDNKKNKEQYLRSTPLKYDNYSKTLSNNEYNLLTSNAYLYGHLLIKGKATPITLLSHLENVHSIYLSIKNTDQKIIDLLNNNTSIIINKSNDKRYVDSNFKKYRLFDVGSPYKNSVNKKNKISIYEDSLNNNDIGLIDAMIKNGVTLPINDRLIHEDILYSSDVSVREELLAGILHDTGRVRDKSTGHVEVTLSSARRVFMEQLVELVHGLGYHYAYSEYKNSLRLMIYQEQSESKRSVSNDLIEITSVEKLPDDDSMLFRCLKVDADDGLFVVGDGFFVTHNSTFIHQLITQDIWSKRGGLLLDPHGDLAEASLNVCPPYRIPSVLFIDMADEKAAPGLNPLFLPMNAGENERSESVQTVMDLMTKFFNMEGSHVQLRKNLEAALNALSWVPGATMLEIMDFFNNPDVQETVLSFMPDELVTKESIISVAQNATADTLGSLENRISSFVNNRAMSLTFGQSIPTLDMYWLMNNEFTVLFKMSKGNMSEGLFRFYGAYIISLVYRAALKRNNIPEPDRKFFTLYIDEFFNFMTGDIDKMLTELRKYALQMFLAYQNLSQISNKAISAAIDNSCRTKIVYKLGAEDASVMRKSFLGMTVADLMSIPRYHVLTQPLVRNENLAPFVSQLMAPLVFKSPASLITSQVIIENTKKNFMRSKEEIEAEIKTRKELYASHNKDRIIEWFLKKQENANISL